jgi:pSer/pThr/pTyr-binding forkhead associated (FHA) protein
VYGDGVPGSMVEGHRFRFSTPVEGTLQFLPGRLEISSGLDTGREIRFVRVPGPNGTEVTFGRNEGPLYRHIQLRDQTVSREHARMTFLDGRWQLINLSRTNPVAHNGRVLGWEEQRPLEDGDRLEMGEVVFSFRSR